MHIVIILAVAVALGVAGTLYYKHGPVVITQAPEPAPVVEVVTMPGDQASPMAEEVEVEDVDTDDVEQVPSTPVVPTPKPTPTPTPAVPAVSTVSYQYNDGTYSAAGVYTSPAGKEKVSISISLKDDVVIGATFVGESSNSTSDRYLEKFNEGYTPLVVGKKLDSIKLDVVNGASLVSPGFMDALADVKAEAQA